MFKMQALHCKVKQTAGEEKSGERGRVTTCSDLFHLPISTRLPSRWRQNLSKLAPVSMTAKNFSIFSKKGALVDFLCWKGNWRADKNDSPVDCRQPCFYTVRLIDTHIPQNKFSKPVRMRGHFARARACITTNGFLAHNQINKKGTHSVGHPDVRLPPFLRRRIPPNRILTLICASSACVVSSSLSLPVCVSFDQSDHVFSCFFVSW